MDTSVVIDELTRIEHQIKREIFLNSKVEGNLQPRIEKLKMAAHGVNDAILELLQL